MAALWARPLRVTITPPLVHQNVVRSPGPMSLQSILDSVAAHVALASEQKWANHDFQGTLVHHAGEGFEELAGLQVFGEVVEMGDEAPEAVIVVARAHKANDRQYAAHIEVLWNKYLQDSLGSDDTDAQFQEYLRLKRIYEPNFDTRSPC